MRVHFIVNSGQRALGAMFTKNLNDEILVFFYPHSARRTFHTFFCPHISHPSAPVPIDPFHADALAYVTT